MESPPTRIVSEKRQNVTILSADFEIRKSNGISAMNMQKESIICIHLWKFEQVCNIVINTFGINNVNSSSTESGNHQEKWTQRLCALAGVNSVEDHSEVMAGFASDILKVLTYMR